MRDPTPGGPTGVPCTREEYVRAQLQVRSQQEADALATQLFDSPTLIGAQLMDGDLLLLALLSEELATRVISWRPTLRREIESLRADPQRTQAMLASWRAAVREDARPRHEE